MNLTKYLPQSAAFSNLNSFYAISRTRQKLGLMKIDQLLHNYSFWGEWHVHTDYTDGRSSVIDYTSLAHELNIPTVAFTEHVSVECSYDYDNLLTDIEMAREKYPDMNILSGFEAKVLPDGTLNCPDSILEKADLKIFAFHSFPQNKEKYMLAIREVISNYELDVWAHPGLFLKNTKI